jgi:NADH:ubiquinone oxidoreductase subunit K
MDEVLEMLAASLFKILGIIRRTSSILMLFSMELNLVFQNEGMS